VSDPRTPFSPRGQAILEEVRRFAQAHLEPTEERYERELLEVGPIGTPPVLDELRALALDRGLWNLFLPQLDPEAPGTPLSTLDYAPVSEILGRYPHGPEALNCNAPDTGNMEILAAFGSPTVKERYLAPLLAGEIRSAFSMTEPDVASSDPTGLTLTIRREGDELVLNGRKWFSTGALLDRCAVLVVMGLSDPDAPPHRRHSMVVVPKDAPGVSFGAEPRIFGYHDRGGHPEILYRDVRVPMDHLLGGLGDGFAIAQARLGPGRVHHCMRTLGAAERALDLMVTRSLERRPFGASLAQRGQIQEWIAESRIEIDMARQYVLAVADQIDRLGAKAAATGIAGIKVVVPRIALRVVDRAIQVHGAAGVTQFTPLARLYAHLRTLRIADGPDEVHLMTVARREIRRHHPGFRLGVPQVPDHAP
jgi:acyl-CoA dehydrogenase